MSNKHTEWENNQTIKGGATHDYLSLKEGTIMRGYQLKQANRIATRQFKRLCNNDEWFWNWIVNKYEPRDLGREIGITGQSDLFLFVPVDRFGFKSGIN